MQPFDHKIIIMRKPLLQGLLLHLHTKDAVIGGRPVLLQPGPTIQLLSGTTFCKEENRAYGKKSQDEEDRKKKWDGDAEPCGVSFHIQKSCYTDLKSYGDKKLCVCLCVSFGLHKALWCLLRPECPLSLFNIVSPQTSLK